MLFVSRLSLPEQAQVLVASLAEHGTRLDAKRAQRLCLQLAGREEKAAAQWLQRELAKARVQVKYTHARCLIGKVAGRSGLHEPGVPAKTCYQLMLAGLETPRGWNVAASEPKELLELLCTAVHGWGGEIRSPRVATLRRAERELMLEQNPLHAGGFLATLKVSEAADWEAWFKFQSYAVERLRRIIEEAPAPVFVDGAVLAMLPSAKQNGVRELAVYSDGVELGRGTELHVLELLEAEAGDELLAADVDGNHIRTRSHAFSISEVHRRLEPFEFSQRTLLHPETQRLLRQYRLFRRKVGKALAPLQLSGRYVAPDGLPENVPVNWDAVKAAMATQGMSLAAVSERAHSTDVEEALISRPLVLRLASFVQLASALESTDFNALVRRATWGEAAPATENALRSVLYAVDELRFVVSSQFEPEPDAQLREACSNLAASRKVREMQLAREVDPPLDEMVFAQDGAEFLATAAECNAEVRMAMVPCFLTAQAAGLSAEAFELPAVGRRLSLLLRPQQVTDKQVRHG